VEIPSQFKEIICKEILQAHLPAVLHQHQWASETVSG